MTNRPYQITRYDGRLAGCKYVVKTATNRAAVSCPDTRRITVSNLANAGAVVGSLVLGRTPGAIAYLGSKVWVITADGYVERLTNADTPVHESSSDRLYSDRATWLTTCNGFLIAPSRSGSVMVLNTLGEIVGQIDGILSRIELAVGDTEHFYCLDGQGNGAAVKIATDGSLVRIQRFVAQDCQGVMRGHIKDDNLVVAVDQLEAVVVFSLDDSDNPERLTRTEYPGTHLNSVLNDADHMALTEEERDEPGLHHFYPITHGLEIAAEADLFIHRDTGRLSYVTSTLVVDIEATIPVGILNIDTNHDISVVLAQAPASDETVTFTPPAGMVIVSGAELTFTTVNWNVPQTLRVTSPTELDTSIDYTVTAEEGGYLTGSIAIEIDDANTYDLVESVTPGNHYSTLTYPIGIVLEQEPGGDNDHTVVFTLPTGLTLAGGGTMTFTRDTWDISQDLEVTIDDSLVGATFSIEYEITSPLGSPVTGAFDFVSTIPTVEDAPADPNILLRRFPTAQFDWIQTQEYRQDLRTYTDANSNVSFEESVDVHQADHSLDTCTIT